VEAADEIAEVTKGVIKVVLDHLLVEESLQELMLADCSIRARKPNSHRMFFALGLPCSTTIGCPS